MPVHHQPGQAAGPAGPAGLGHKVIIFEARFQGQNAVLSAFSSVAVLSVASNLVGDSLGG